MARRVYIETYGCSLNHADTALMKTVLVRRGYELVNDLDKADVVIVNTCTVRLDTEERMKKRLKRLQKMVADKRLVVAGCLAAAQPFLVKKVAPNAVLVSPQNVHMVHMAVEEGCDLLGEPKTPKTVFVPDAGIALRGGYAEVPIVDGCLGNCSFCITKLARRHVDSRPMEKIVEYVASLVRRGVVEIRLTGQDTAVYGIDLVGRRLLPELLQRITEIPGNFMVRIGMMSPDQLLPILDEVVEAIKHPKIYKFLHIPVQSGSNKVLKVMNRRYSVEDIYEIVKTVRSKVPGVTIATDIIVGHPGEEEEDFEATLEMVKNLRFERVHVAQYTPRPRTLAAVLEQVPDPVKKIRSKKLMALIERIGYEEHNRYVGTRARALIIGLGERGGYEARLYNYIPVVLTKTPPCTRCWADIEITSSTWYDVRGVVIG